jgi:pimeloyl-ACP methyl ester carboxylesterase
LKISQTFALAPVRECRFVAYNVNSSSPPQKMRFFYLHGFASSAASRKARFFTEKLKEHGIRLEALDLAPDFPNMTITGQLAVIENAARRERVVLIGSSLGGYLAALFAARHPEAVDRLVLLAPAFDFYQLWEKELGPVKLREWREKRTMPVYHFGEGRQASIGFQLMEDSLRYPGFPDFKQPCLLLHGLADEAVPFEKSARFVAAHLDNAQLIPFESGHELTDVLNEIWKTSGHFLLNAGTAWPV